MKKVVENFKPTGGMHCITNALKQVFDYSGYSLTEEMIFGIGSGLSFCYLNLEKAPMVSGRTKPFEFEKILAERLNIEIKCKTNENYQSAFDKTIKLINEDKPVLIYADMAYLDYLNLDKDSHFGGHAVVLFGYDDESKKFYVSDRDNSNYAIRTPKGNISKDFHLVDFDRLEMARCSTHRPFPANKKYLELNFTKYCPMTKAIIYSAINETCENMLNAKAQLLGLNGIKKFSKEILKWSNFDEAKLKAAGVTNYFQISSDGGTGGGIFRKMYGEFLLQASDLLKIVDLNQIGNDYISISNKWDKIAQYLWQLSETANKDILKECSSLLKNIHAEEYIVLTRLKEIINK